MPCFSIVVVVVAKSLQSCPTLCDPIDCSPPGSPVPGILQARTLEWVAIFFSNVWKWEVKVKLLSRVRLLATPWTAAHQAHPSMGFSRQEYWNGVPLPSPAPHIKSVDRDFSGGPVIRTSPSIAGGAGLIPGWGSHMPRCQKSKTYNRSNNITNSIKIF